MENRSVIVLQDARAVRDNLAQELAKRDFAVRSCGSLAGFRHLYSSQPSPLVVLTGESDDLACDAQSVRMAAPGAVIIALGSAADAAWRTHVMTAGADACHAASIDIAELTAILLSWSRTLVQSTSSLAKDLVPAVPMATAAPVTPLVPMAHLTSLVPPAPVSPLSPMSPGHKAERVGRFMRSGQPGRPRSARSGPPRPPGSFCGVWRLDANCRVLLCPQGRMLFLTAAENCLFMRIAASEGQLLRRQQPAAAPGMSDEGNASSAASVASGLDPRSMDVVVSRLRRKARDASIDLPLLAVRGCGYLFAEWLAVSPAPAAPGSPAPTARIAPQSSSQFLPPLPTKPIPLAEPRAPVYALSLLAA